MAGLLDFLTDKERPEPLLLLMGLAGAAGSRSKGEAVSNGLQGLLQGVVAMDNKKDEDAKYLAAQERQRRQDAMDEQLKQAQIQHYLAQQKNGADPYWTTLDTPNGFMKFNARTGEALPIDVNGQPIIKSSSDVGLQSAIAGGKKNAETANTMFEQEGSDGSKSRFMGNQLPNYNPSLQSQQPVPQSQTPPFNVPANNNVGNLRNLNGQGFQSFPTPQAGMDALSRQIGLYSTKHGIDNLQDFTARYAPKGDGNNNPAAYAKFLSQQTGIPVDAHGVDFSNPEINAAMTRAIPIMEQGWRSNPSAANKQVSNGNAFSAPVIQAAQSAVENGTMTRGQATQMAQSVAKGIQKDVVNPFKSQSTADKLAQETVAKNQQEQDKANIALAQKQAENAQKQTNSANNSNEIIAKAEPLINEATDSGLGHQVDNVMAYFGKSTKGADSAAALQTLGARLVMQMPRMEGPQSDKDVELYKTMAGKIGDPWTPKSQRIASLQVIKELNSKYATPTQQQVTPNASNSGWSIRAMD